MDTVIGIGEYAVSQGEAHTIKTYALASCVAVTAYSPLKKVGGMVHVALPFPTGGDSKQRPGYFATTGVPMLVDKLCQEFGCRKGELKIQIYGGAKSINENDIFNIGKKNIEAVIQILTNLKLKVHKLEVGGTNSRTIEMDLTTGYVKVSIQPIRI